MSKVVVFDYGAGNLRSVLNTLGAIGAQYELVDDAAGLQGLHAREARRWRQVHTLGQLHVGERTVLLQLSQDSQVHRVQLH